MNRRLLTFALILTAVAAAQGCAIPTLIGGMQQNFEYEKQLDVPAAYEGLQGRTVAIVVDVDPATLYEHPDLPERIVGLLSGEILRNVPEARLFNPRATLGWQYQTPAWNGLPYGEMAKQLHAERLIYIDVYEYRLHPIGNRYEWNGMCQANVFVIENDEASLDPDTPVEEWLITGQFPDFDGVGWESAEGSQIAQGVIWRFVQRTSWLFYRHLEDKYPGKRTTGREDNI